MRKDYRLKNGAHVRKEFGYNGYRYEPYYMIYNPDGEKIGSYNTWKQAYEEAGKLTFDE